MAGWLYIQLEARGGFYFTKGSSYLHLRGDFFIFWEFSSEENWDILVRISIPGWTLQETEVIRSGPRCPRVVTGQCQGKPSHALRPVVVQSTVYTAKTGFSPLPSLTITRSEKPEPVLQQVRSIWNTLCWNATFNKMSIHFLAGFSFPTLTYC